ncbi:hypothetical protein JRO89_XS07G0025900 [Xanthoceras sorbifolium]|uniref:Cytochrome P450 n=1 Tax=Xanthoceras sorbifolium TaxID=99658 RepID=A0ABQ8HS94_9ROSI|nr:hypothetical protein JRO89_XS07G0025900 [Xanthoceras sorbifolium]
MISLTNAIICRVALGRRYEDAGIESSTLHALLEERMAILGGFYYSDYFPFMGWIDKLRGMISRLEKNFKEFDQFYQEIINGHLDPNGPKREQEDIIDVLLQIQKELAASNPVNLSELMMFLTSTIICRVAFGKRYEDEGIERSRFHALLNETQAMFASFFVSDYFPFMGWVDRLTGLKSRLERNFKDCDTFYQELIDDHLDSNKPKSEQKDIIDVLLQLREQRSFKIDLTIDHIKGVLMNRLD